MGEATVTENLGAGQYKIKLSDEIDRIQEEITAKQAIVDNIVNTLIPAATDTYNAAQADYDAKKGIIDGLSDELAILQQAGDLAGIQAKMAEIREKMPELLRAQADRDKAYRAVQTLNLQKMVAQQDVDKWQALYDGIEDDIRIAWAVDYTDDLEVGAKVGLAEINSEPKGTVNIAPGGASTSGKSVPIIGLGRDEFYVNKALKPAWQKWQPTYRIAIILEMKTGDNCDVALFPAKSTEQGIDINQEGIDYRITDSGFSVPGWDRFIENNPTFPMSTETDSTQIPDTAQLRQDLETVNREVNAQHTYRRDQSLDTWNFMEPGGYGDCDDFALTKAQRLIAMGYPASAIHIEIGAVRGNAIDHAWLVVQTDGGDYALDNRYSNVMNNWLLPYENRHRQTGPNWDQEGVRLNDVPIEYMDGINGAAFAVNDRVVVKFIDQDWEQPVVIGFETNPKLPGDYFIFYWQDDAPWIGIANISDTGEVSVSKQISASSAGIAGFVDPQKVFCHVKKFTHKVRMLDASYEDRELYFVAMSLHLNTTSLAGGGSLLDVDSDGDPHCCLYIYDPTTTKFHLLTGGTNGSIPYQFQGQSYPWRCVWPTGHFGFPYVYKTAKCTINFSSDQKEIFHSYMYSAYSDRYVQTETGYAIESVSETSLSKTTYDESFPPFFIDRDGLAYRTARYTAYDYLVYFTVDIKTGTTNELSLHFGSGVPNESYSDLIYDAEIYSPDGYYDCKLVKSDLVYTVTTNTILCYPDNPMSSVDEQTRIRYRDYTLKSTPGGQCFEDWERYEDYPCPSTSATTYWQEVYLAGHYTYVPTGSLLSKVLGDAFYEKVSLEYKYLNHQLPIPAEDNYTNDHVVTLHTPMGESIASDTCYRSSDSDWPDWITGDLTRLNNIKKPYPWFHLQADDLINGFVVADKTVSKDIPENYTNFDVWGDKGDYNLALGSLSVERGYFNSSSVFLSSVSSALGISSSNIMGVIMAPFASIL